MMAYTYQEITNAAEDLIADYMRQADGTADPITRVQMTAMAEGVRAMWMLLTGYKINEDHARLWALVKR